MHSLYLRILSENIPGLLKFKFCSKMVPKDKKNGFR